MCQAKTIKILNNKDYLIFKYINLELSFLALSFGQNNNMT